MKNIKSSVYRGLHEHVGDCIYIYKKTTQLSEFPDVSEHVVGLVLCAADEVCDATDLKLREQWKFKKKINLVSSLLCSYFTSTVSLLHVNLRTRLLLLRWQPERLRARWSEPGCRHQQGGVGRPRGEGDAPPSGRPEASPPAASAPLRLFLSRTLQPHQLQEPSVYPTLTSDLPGEWARWF